jgi:DNA-binding CsgD family transcriptional regulator/tetratricopeptide (TPR) repeat protein
MSELLERKSQLDALESAFAAVRSGSRGRLALISGEAGVGKTSLLRRFCGEQEGVARVLWGSCDALFTPAPLGPLQDVAEQTQGKLKEVVESAGRPHDVATALLGELTARTPTIVVLEDLHWADEATLDVVRLLARRVESVPALLLATYRDDELDRAHPLRLVLGEVATSQDVSRLSVPPLSPTGVAELAAPHGFDPDELYRTTGGNPFFVTEVLATGRDEIPATVRDAVLARVARLDPRARTVVEVVAIAPREMEAWLVDTLAGDAADRLDESLAAGILVARPGAVAFRHELARIAVEESLPPNLRVALHAQVLATLTSQAKGTPDAARLAHHAEEAGDEHSVLRFAPQAAVAAAAVGAHREAAAQYARTFRFEGGLGLDERADLLGRRAHECTLIGEFTEAIGMHHAALECHRRLGDVSAEGDSLRALSWLLWTAGRVEEAEAAADGAIAALEGEPPQRGLTLAHCTRSDLFRYDGDFARAVDSGARALALAQAIGDSEGELHAQNAIAAAEYLADVRGKDEQLDRILRRVLDAGLDGLAASAYCTLAFGAVSNRRHAEAEFHIEAGIDHCRGDDLDGWRPFLVAMRAELELEQGRWSDAVESAGHVLSGVAGERHTGHGFGPGTVFSLAVLGRIRARRGDPDPWTPLDEALALAEPSGQLHRLRPVAAARAEAAWLEGRAELIPDEVGAAFELAVRQSNSWALGQLAFWRWRAGIEEEMPAGAAEPFAAQVAGDWRRAADLWAELGCPYERALALADADDDDALRRALEVLQELGARPAAAMVARRLRERGARGVPRGPRASTRQNEANLTPRQVEVLALLSEGLRNSDIAERLFLSDRTVQHHVSAILSKLGVQSRGQAAAEAIRLGIAGRN